MSESAPPPSTVLSDRYAIFGELASGGMASVLFGRLKGPVGFARAVAIKRMHPHIAREPSFVSMFIDEARICARLSHANIVPTLDVIQGPSELCLVMEYVHGAALDVLIDSARARGEPIPVRVAVALVAGVLHGLHAAHETRGEDGESLGIVHRDVSPPNVLIGEDGVARVLDFGIAKAAGKLRTTPSGEVKGKLAYMAPEQFTGAVVTRRVDVYGAAAVLWETLIGRPLFEGASESEIVYKVLNEEHRPPSQLRADVPAVLDAIVLRGLSRVLEQRFESAREMALALELQVGGASQSEVSEWVRTLAGPFLDARATELRNLQQSRESSGEPLAREGGGRGTRKVSPLPLTARDTAQRAPAPPGDETAPTVVPKKRRLALVAVLFAGGLAAAIYALSASREPAPQEVAESAERAEPPVPPSASAPVPAAASPTAVPPPTVPPATPPPRLRPTEESPTQPPSDGPASEAKAKSSRSERQNARGVRDAGRRSGRVGSDGTKNDCDPPYRWSPLGVKIYKRECL